MFAFLWVLTLKLHALALVSCSPSSCSPGCDSSCTYFTCSQSASINFAVNKVPFSYTAQSNACSDSSFELTAVSFVVDGVTYPKIPTDVSHKYLVCQAQTAYGPPCPPPTPPADPAKPK